MNPLNHLKQELEEKDYTCVIGNEENILFTSKDKGVKPLLDFFQSDEYKKHTNIYVADKIIGKGAAFLLIAMSVKGLYTPIISESAQDLLFKHHTDVISGEVVPYIKNRAGDGRCPIESSVVNEDNIEKALQKINQTLEKLRNNALNNN